jgi:hypothetical protein
VKVASRNLLLRRERENNISVDFFNNLKRLKNAATNFCIIDRYLVLRMWEGTKERKEKSKEKKRKRREEE